MPNRYLVLGILLDDWLGASDEPHPDQKEVTIEKKGIINSKLEKNFASPVRESEKL